MAVCRRGAALWFTYGRSLGGSPVVQGEGWKLPQGTYLFIKSNHDWLPSSPFRTISNISWALAPPSCTCSQTVSQSTIDPSLTHRIPHIGQPIRLPCREETVSLCVLLGPGDGGGQHTLIEIPLSEFTGFSELPSGSANSSKFIFPLTTVDARREDDINVRGRGREGKREAKVQERESFQSFFEKESCPAPFVWGSRFYCFHCPVADSLLGCTDKSTRTTRLEAQTSAFSTPVSLSYYANAVTERGEGMDEREREREEKLALMYEKMRHELPRFFLKNHDYSMYSPDIEFINGLLNIKTRGWMLYQLCLSLWKLLCVFYFADVRLEVLKLSKHSEDGTVRARWRVNGLPFHLLMLRFYRRDKRSLYRSYDAFSTFYLGSDGLIHCHRVDKVLEVFHRSFPQVKKSVFWQSNDSGMGPVPGHVMPAQPPALPRVTSMLAGALVALGLQEHRPALNLLPFLLSYFRIGLGRQ